MVTILTTDRSEDRLQLRRFTLICMHYKNQFNDLCFKLYKITHAKDYSLQD